MAAAETPDWADEVYDYDQVRSSYDMLDRLQKPTYLKYTLADAQDVAVHVHVDCTHAGWVCHAFSVLADKFDHIAAMKVVDGVGDVSLETYYKSGFKLRTVDCPKIGSKCVMCGNDELDIKILSVCNGCCKNFVEVGQNDFDAVIQKLTLVHAEEHAVKKQRILVDNPGRADTTSLCLQKVREMEDQLRTSMRTVDQTVVAWRNLWPSVRAITSGKDCDLLLSYRGETLQAKFQINGTSTNLKEFIVHVVDIIRHFRVNHNNSTHLIVQCNTDHSMNKQHNILTSSSDGLWVSHRFSDVSNVKEKFSSRCIVKGCKNKPDEHIGLQRCETHLRDLGPCNIELISIERAAASTLVEMLVSWRR